ncbi:MAG: rRNA pseudouridine synthase [Bacteroidetes bacterium]|nr:MAG: rRNA pseudouridine synthase [Bacteroidota bacterium]
MENPEEKKPRRRTERKTTAKDNKKEKYTTKGKFKKSPDKEKYKKKIEKIEKPEPIRLNKFIAASGICSRRDADELIKKGKVKLEGKVVTEMGLKVDLSANVLVNNKIITPEKKVYILINKPKDYISTVDDPHAERTVIDLIRNATKERVYPVGRLDRNTTGVLLLTNDGDLTKKLTHPSFNKKKIYHISLNKAVVRADLDRIAEGIELDDGFIKADAINFVDGNKKEIGIEMHSGRNRIVRRIFEYLGYRVVKLDRVYFAGLTKKSVPRGKWRFLEEKEISMLKMGAFE